VVMHVCSNMKNCPSLSAGRKSTAPLPTKRE
jgi:hypothetical protein